MQDLSLSKCNTLCKLSKLFMIHITFLFPESDMLHIISLFKVFLSFWTINRSVFRHVFIKSSHASNLFQCRHFKILVGVKKNNKKPCLGISVTEYLTISILKKSLIGSLECSDRVVFQKHFLNYPSFFPFNLNTLKNSF